MRPRFLRTVFPQPISLIQTSWLGYIITLLVLIGIFFPIAGIFFLLSWMFLEVRKERRIPEMIHGDIYAAYELQPLTLRFFVAGIIIFLVGEMNVWWKNRNISNKKIYAQNFLFENVAKDTCYYFERNFQFVYFRTPFKPTKLEKAGSVVTFKSPENVGRTVSWDEFLEAFDSLPKPITFIAPLQEKGGKICF